MGGDCAGAGPGGHDSSSDRAGGVDVAARGRGCPQGLLKVGQDLDLTATPPDGSVTVEFQVKTTRGVGVARARPTPAWYFFPEPEILQMMTAMTALCAEMREYLLCWCRVRQNAALVRECLWRHGRLMVGVTTGVLFFGSVIGRSAAPTVIFDRAGTSVTSSDILATRRLVCPIICCFVARARYIAHHTGNTGTRRGGT